MEPTEKISPLFRERLANLGEDETICVLVNLRAKSPRSYKRGTRSDRKRRIAAASKQTEKAVDSLVETIERGGGEVLGVSKPLSILTVQANRSLIEQLVERDEVAAIIENQAIRGIDSAE